ncbi:alginate O-acetyltransferase AlgX-related protein [Fimbriiglobus ruber]|uniref:AlgX/AlgJ SGNH hydrolase-like domain-containing protein n=1 Tax=Fimbriiglobus ruber TaxID=1908690 RepID=A0A225DEE4_9BACT|nr:hypothetical protein [Fimbriiglobus ruber]OWK35519.1 hypothetical protein FRUB_08082 [Fimbriiglobus ruber]
MTRLVLRFLTFLRAVRVSAGGVRRAANAVTILMFLGGLAFPLYGYLLHEPAPPRNELRPLFPSPGIPRSGGDLRLFPAAFEPYFNDRVGYRQTLLDWQRSVVFDTLGDSTVRNVWVGRKGWLYLDVAVKRDIPPPPLAAWADTLADRHAWCAARGLVYVALIAPEKSEIYPEYLPGRLRNRPLPDLITGLHEQLHGTPVRLVDVRPALFAAKRDEPVPVYFRLDSHWTSIGGLAAYQVVGRALAETVPGFTPTPAAAFRRVPTTFQGQDLSRMIGCTPERCTAETEYLVGPRTPTVRALSESARAALTADDLLWPEPMSESDCSGAQGPPAILIGDSFSWGLLTPFQTDFRRLTRVLMHEFPKTLIEQEKPKVIVQEIVYRRLREAPPTDPVGVAGARLQVGER